jgi:integrase
MRKIMLTIPAHYLHSYPRYWKGGDYLAGSIHWKRDRYAVAVYWKGKTEWFWRSKNGDPLLDKRQANKLLGMIQADISIGSFDPRTYRPQSPLAILEYQKVWLEASNACANTKKVYRNAIKHVMAAVDSRGERLFGPDFDIRDFTYSKLSILHKSLDLSPDAKYNVLTALKTMRRLYKKDVPTFIMPESPPLSKQKPETTEYLAFDEQQEVLSAIPERHRPIFIVMMEYGIRPQEGTALMLDCLTDKKVIFKRSHSEYKLMEKTKTGIIREEFITTRAREAFAAAKEIRESLKVKTMWVFVKNARGSHYDSKALNRIWHEACEKAGIKIPLYEAVRHSLGCQLVDEGYSIDFIQDVYKHTKIDTTRRYAKRQRAQIGEALENRGKIVPFKKESASN